MPLMHLIGILLIQHQPVLPEKARCFAAAFSAKPVVFVMQAVKLL